MAGQGRGRSAIRPDGGRRRTRRPAGDELQTDETFDEGVVERMGSAFYNRVFSPAIEAAVERGERYDEFRDAIRKEWKPGKTRSDK